MNDVDDFIHACITNILKNWEKTKQKTSENSKKKFQSIQEYFHYGSSRLQSSRKDCAEWQVLCSQNHKLLNDYKAYQKMAKEPKKIKEF